MFFPLLGNVLYAFTSNIEEKHFSNAVNMVKEINLLYENMKESSRQSILMANACGSLYNKAKKHLSKKDFRVFISKTKFSRSWCYFLIAFNNLVNEYKGLQQCCLPVSKLQKFFTVIKEYIKLDKYSMKWKNIM